MSNQIYRFFDKYGRTVIRTWLADNEENILRDFGFTRANIASNFIKFLNKK